MKANPQAITWILVLLGFVLGGASGPESLSALHFGPNLRHQFMGNAPFAWGTWVPQADARIDFSWIEPLNAAHYGDEVTDSSRFMRLQGVFAVSPYYIELQTAIGVAPFQANPQVELRFVYSNLFYLGTNVEMAMGDRARESSISRTWRSDYIYDSYYDESTFDQYQSFGFWADLDLRLSKARLLAAIHYTLMDIRTDYDGKSFDYTRGLPVYSRDFVFEGSAFATIPIGRSWDWVCDGIYYSTGYLRDATGTYTKEPMGYVRTLTGPSWHWDEGHSRLTITPGYWLRTKESAYDGSLAEQFILQLHYQRNWKFAFAR